MNALEMKTSYEKWLSLNEQYKDLNDKVVRIDTPFLDDSLDNIIIYAENLPDGRINLNDDGWTMDYLETHGFTFRKGSNRYNLLHSTLDIYGLELSDDVIQISCNPTRFPIAKQRIVQGLIKINDLLFLNNKNVINTFKNDILTILSNNKVAYDAPYTITGKNGYTYSFDFSIPVIGGTKKLVNTISQPNKISYSKLYMADAQLSSKIDPSASFYAILNDENEINDLDEIKDIFLNLSEIPITPILRSETNKIKEMLTNNA